MPEEPGWYDDPKGESNFRFYDGRKWTTSVATDKPAEVREDDGPVEGGLMGLLGHQPLTTPTPTVNPFGRTPVEPADQDPPASPPPPPRPPPPPPPPPPR